MSGTGFDDGRPAEPLLSLETFARYRRHGRHRGYCDPFIPFVGADYATAAPVKLVYCGGAARWCTAPQTCNDDAAAWLESRRAFHGFGAMGAYASPFWRLLEDIARTVPGLASLPDLRAVMRHIAWTNLSKTGLVNRSAPPSNDAVLRALDVAQFDAEMDMLRPDLLICVSGTLVRATGDSLFDRPDWPAVETPVPRLATSSIRRTPWGGWMMRTMHPNRKSRDWRRQVVDDVGSILLAMGHQPIGPEARPPDRPIHRPAGST